MFDLSWITNFTQRMTYRQRQVGMKQILELKWDFVCVHHFDFGAEFVWRQNHSVCQVDTVRPILLIFRDEGRRVEVEDQIEAGALLSLHASNKIPSAVPGKTVLGHLGCAMIGWRSRKIRKDLNLSSHDNDPLVENTHDWDATAQRCASIQHRSGREEKLLLFAARRP